MKITHIINISGGKDSAAVSLLAIDRLFVDGKVKNPNHEVVFVFADTQHEADLTYKNLDYMDKFIHQRTGQHIIRVTNEKNNEARFAKRRKAIARDWKKEGVAPKNIKTAIENMYPTGNAFVDLAKLKGGFPSAYFKFCTRELKIEPIYRQIELPRVKQGRKIIKWLGIRRDESQNRADAPLYRRPQTKKEAGIYTYQPIRHWTKEQVFAFLEEKGMKRCKLYDMGFTRVGCLACIYASHNEIKLIGEKFPHRVKEIEAMEQEVSKCTKGGKASLIKAPTKAARALVKHTDYQFTFGDMVRHVNGHDITYAQDFEELIASGKIPHAEKFLDAEEMNDEELTAAHKADDCDAQGYCS